MSVLLLQLKARVEELERKLEEQQQAQLEERGTSCSLTNRGPRQALKEEKVIIKLVESDWPLGGAANTHHGHWRHCSQMQVKGLTG